MISHMQDELTAAIAADLGISNLPIEEQKTVISQFGQVALKAATLSVISQLSPDKRDEFAKLAETGDASALKAFLDQAIPDHENVVKAAVAEEVKRFKDFQNP